MKIEIIKFFKIVKGQNSPRMSYSLPFLFRLTFWLSPVCAALGSLWYRSNYLQPRMKILEFSQDLFLFISCLVFSYESALIFLLFLKDGMTTCSKHNRVICCFSTWSTMCHSFLSFLVVERMTTLISVADQASFTSGCFEDCAPVFGLWLYVLPLFGFIFFDVPSALWLLDVFNHTWDVSASCPWLLF